MFPKAPTKQHTFTPLYKGVICCCIGDGWIFANTSNLFNPMNLINLFNMILNIVSVYGLKLISFKRSYHQNLEVLEIDEASNEYRCFLHRYSYWLFLCPSISQIGNKL